MKLLIEKHMDSLKETFLFANTPRYLYKNYRHKLAELSDHYSVQEIWQELERIGPLVKDQDMDSMVYLYALFALLTFHDYTKVRPHLDQLKQMKLRWMKEMVSLYRATARVSFCREEVFPPPPINYTISALDNNIPASISIPANEIPETHNA